MTCNHCQEHLLHYLYDVLDDAEKALVAQHLEECPMCQAARNGLRAQQELLAEAAKESFALVSFQPPAETPRRLGEPTLAMPRRQRGFSWVRVAIAASIFVFVFGGGTMGVMGWFQTQGKIEVAQARVETTRSDQQGYQQSLQKHQTQTQEEIKAIQEQIDRLFKDWSRDALQVHKENAVKPKIVLTGPRNNPAGAQPTYNFDIANTPRGTGPPPPAGAPPQPAAGALMNNEGSRANVQVYDKLRNETIFEQQLPNVRAQGNNFKTPPFPVPPGNNDWTLRVDLLNKDGKVEAQEELSLSSLEYLTHLMTDRPMYRPGEVVRFRSLTLERFSLKPAQEDLHLVYRVLGPNQQEIFKLEGAATLLTDEEKQPIKGPDGKPLRGVGAGAFQLARDAAGGQYTISLSEGQNRFPAEKRAFLVNQWQMPRMNKELKFHRSSYGPGELVEVHAKAMRSEGGAPLAGQPAKVQAVVDGNIVHAVNLVTKADGTLNPIRFALPAAGLMKNGHGSISIEFHDGAGPEPIVKPIPIVLNKLYVEFFPEGGDLVGGVANRVYFQVKNTLGKPAELKGRIIDQNGAVSANVETLHDDLEEGINQGQGAFTFTPAAGKRYQLKIDTPIGVQPLGTFPATQAKGVVLRLPKPIADGAIDVEVTSADTQRLLMVGAYCRGRLLDQRHIGAPAGKTQSITLKTEPGVSGVYRITVYEIVVKGDDTQYLPRAERLTYRKGAERVNVALDGVQESHVPGERVNLKLKAQDEQKRKTPVVALVSVIDLSLVKLADDKTERGMPTHFMLTSEIRQPEDFENADVLLGKHPKAEAALDHLLGTQGWRRFAEQDPQRFQQQYVRDASRILNSLALTSERRDSINDIVTEKVDRVFAVKALKLQDQLATKEAVENGPPDAAQQQNILQTNVVNAGNALEDARASLHNYEQRMVQYLLGALVIGALVIGLGAIALGVRRLGQGRSALAALVTGTALLLFLFMGSLAGVFYMIGSKGDPVFALNKPFERKAADVAMVAAQAEAGGPPPAAPPMMAEGAAPGGPPLAAMPAKEMRDVAADEKQDRMQMAKKAPDAQRFVLEQKELPRKMRAPAPAPVQMALMPPGGGPVPQQGAFGEVGNVGQVMGGAGQAGGFQGQLRQMPFGGGFGGRGGQMQIQERELRQQKNYLSILERRMNRAIEVPQELPPLFVREYAHKQKESNDKVRNDFTETVCWQPAVVMPDGVVEVGFDLSDAVTRYQVTVFSHSLDGRLGADRFELAARLPFSIDPKVPFEVCNTDKLVIPVAVKNDTKDEGQIELAARASGLKTHDPQARDTLQARDVLVGAGERGRGLFTYEPAVVAGQATLRVKGTMRLNQLADTVEREFKIVPDGFPMRGAQSGLLEKAAVHDIPLPNAWVPGTLSCQVQVFPSTLAELQKGLEGLLREPCGCFEQSSSSNYPNVLILNYLREAGQGDPNIEQRARSLLQSGYQRLTSFECTDPSQAATKRGYEWFGQTAPPHEALTAYGLLQFHDMANVYAVDKDMVERTTKYLLDQRDGQGGFRRNSRAIDSFGRAPEHITNAYIVWALTDAGVNEDLTKELAALATKAADSKDPYFVALVALGHMGQNRANDAIPLAKRLREMQKDDGRLEGGQTSITGSQGRDLQLETTALAVLAWLKANRPEEFHTSVDKAVKWIGGQRSGQGSFGATQSTILALKALIAHTRDVKKIAEDGKLTVTLPERNNQAVAEASYTAGASEPITLTLPEGKGLAPGKNKVVIETTGKNALPYTLSWTYQTLTPPSDAGCPVKLSAKLSKQNAQEGDTVKLKATVENATDKGHGMTVAILGLPAGLTIPEDAKQLKEMAKLRDQGTKPGVISHWELKDRELVLYWRDLAPKAKIDVELDLICRLPGTYRGPASRAYLYYNADAKTWIEPLQVVIDAQRGD